MTQILPTGTDEDESHNDHYTSNISYLQTFPNEDNTHNAVNGMTNIQHISPCDLEESLDNDEDNNNAEEEEEAYDDSPDTYENHIPLQPIVVGYAFGPKKMSTMSAVMEKASLWDHQEEVVATPTATARKPHEKQQQQQQKVVFTVGESDLGLMLGHLAASSNESIGTCTASYASSSTTTGRSRQAAWKIPPISFVPMEHEDESSNHKNDSESSPVCQVILHKLTEDILCTSLLAQRHSILHDLSHVPTSLLSTLPLTPSEHAAVRRVHRLCHPPPGCVVVDNPIHVQTVMNRANICQTLSQCLSSLPRVQCPASTVVTHTDQCHGLQFPVILKPLIAAGTQSSHHMAILFADSPLPHKPPHVEAWLAQEYRNHGSILYKVYVLGDHVSVHPRRSLPDLPPTGGHSLWFDSQRPYPRPIDFGLSSVQSTNNGSGCSTNCSSPKHLPPLTVHQVQPIASALKEAFQLELFGFDVILEVNNHISSTKSSSSRLHSNGNTTDNEPMIWVVDVNYFPSYKEVPQFPSLLAQFLTQRVLQQQQQQQQSSDLGT